jgi:putative transcriptional regulator
MRRPIRTGGLVGSPRVSLSLSPVGGYTVVVSFPLSAAVTRALIFLCLAWSFPTFVSGAEDQPLRSVLLVASNHITDPNFSHSVVLVTRQAGGGLLGLILNRPTEVSLKELFEGVKGLDARRDRVFFGGPISVQMLVFVYRAGGSKAESVELLPGLFLGSDPKVLNDLLRRERPTRGLRVFAGYSGWADGQLEDEIARGDWHLLEADSDTVFTDKPESLWTDLIRRASLRSARAPVPHGVEARRHARAGSRPDLSRTDSANRSPLEGRTGTDVVPDGRERCVDGACEHAIQKRGQADPSLAELL